MPSNKVKKCTCPPPKPHDWMHLEGCPMVATPKNSEWEKLEKVLSSREEKMYGYYKSVFQENFEGGYPAKWDEEIKELLQERSKDTVGELVKILERQHKEGDSDIKWLNDEHYNSALSDVLQKLSEQLNQK